MVPEAGCCTDLNVDIDLADAVAAEWCDGGAFFFRPFNRKPMMEPFFSLVFVFVTAGLSVSTDLLLPRYMQYVRDGWGCTSYTIAI